MDGFSKTIIIQGTPAPWVATGWKKRSFMPAKQREWYELVRQIAALEMRGEDPFAGCVYLSVSAYLEPPKSWPKWKIKAALADKIGHSTVPDLSNYVKAAEDALTGIVWVDDAQVVSTSSGKEYSKDAGMMIKIIEHPASPSQIKRRDQMPRIDRQEARR